MRNYNEISEIDVRILPKSKAIMATDPYRDALPSTETTLAYLEANWTGQYLMFGDYRVEPNGIDNNFPLNYKALLDSVYIAHGVKRTLVNLLLSGGIGLYREVKEEKKIIRDWQLDADVQDWLDSFEFETHYLPEAATDLVYVENVVSLLNRNKGYRIGQQGKIASLKHLNIEHVRLEFPDEKGVRNNIYVSEWYLKNLTAEKITQIPMFRIDKPFANPTSAMFLKMPTFGSTSYGRPPDIGATQLLKVLSLLPNFHNANLTERGFKWIVSVAQDYYKSIRDKKGWSEDSNEFKQWKIDFQTKIDEFLTATDADKIQTRFMTEFAIDKHTMKPVDTIRIEKLGDDTKELSEVGMSLHDTYTIGYVSANSINPTLANVHLKNHALSGSNLRESYEIHIKTVTPMLRQILLHPVNTAIKLNFPAKNLKIGFMDVAFEDYNQKQTTNQAKTDN